MQTVRETKTAAKVISVTDLTRNIRRLMEGQIGHIWVEGEISNLKAYDSGHTYFTLKDAGAQLRCVVWAEFAAMLNSQLADGKKIQAYGRVSVYEKSGQYQLYVEAAKETGLGALQEAFEKLKARLKSEGLFDPGRKRPLPVFPGAIGVVTSPTGAAIRDFLRALDRRFPRLRIVIAPARVQGEGAAEEISQGIRRLNELDGIDVVIIMRGGGSLEDLWAFNEEVVARALAASRIPTISAVGHEVDFTIGDFVADLRAATPTAAAELVIRAEEEWLGILSALHRHLAQQARLQIAECKDRLADLRAALALREPRQVVRELRERLEELRHRLGSLDPRLMLSGWRQKLARLEASMSRTAAKISLQWRHRIEQARGRLELLNPRATLERGYTMTFDAASGRLQKSSAAIRPGARLRTEFHDGSVDSQVP